MKNLQLLIAALLISGMSVAQSAGVQLIHNSPDSALYEVDVWVDSNKAAADFQFRTAAPFLPVPGGVPFEVRIQPVNSSDTANPLFYAEVTLSPGENYIAVINGFVSMTGYSNTPQLDIDVFQPVRLQAAQPGNTDLLIYHGVPDAPAIDVDEVMQGVGNVIDDISYGEFDGYHPLSSSDYSFQIKDQTGTATLRQYDVPLQSLNLTDSAAVVLASGFIDPSKNSDGPEFGLFAVLPIGGPFIPLPPVTAGIQVIHNSADHAAQSVDLWLTGPAGEMMGKLENVEFQTATPVLPLLASSDSSMELTVHVAPDTSTTPASSFYSQAIFPMSGEMYAAVANGIISASGYDPAEPFGFDIFTGLRSQADVPGNTDMLFYQGVTDAPVLDIFDNDLGLTIVDDITYGEFQGYIEVAPNDADLTVQDQAGNLNIREFEVLSDSLNFADSSLIIVASGFLDPSKNSDGSSFGLYAVLPGGGDFIKMPMHTASVQLIHNSADLAAASVDVYVEGPAGEQIAKVSDMDFRTATPFLKYPSGIDMNLHIAPAGSNDMSESLYDIPVNLTRDEHYLAVASGIISQSGYDPGAGTFVDFDIYIRGDARTSSVNPGETDILFFHGATDAPVVNVVEVGIGAGLISQNLTYSDFDGYIALGTDHYEFQLQLSNGNPVATFDAPLFDLGYEDGAITILLSGFMNTENNSSGPAFGLWVASSSGGSLRELSAATSVNELVRESGINRYPNPARGEVVFELTDRRKSGELKIYGITGTLIETLNITDKITRINLENYPAGTYIYRLKTDAETVGGKFNVIK